MYIFVYVYVHIHIYFFFSSYFSGHKKTDTKQFDFDFLFRTLFDCIYRKFRQLRRDLITRSITPLGVITRLLIKQSML